MLYFYGVLEGLNHFSRYIKQQSIFVFKYYLFVNAR